jgi:diacylglycerol kinase (ATP)
MALLGGNDEAAPSATAPASGFVAVLRGPTAGRGRYEAEVTAALAALAAGGRDVRLLDARTVPAAEAACAEAVASGAAALVAVGGDGTVHLAVQAVAGTGVAFGVVPAGTGNDFATAVGLPANQVDAATAIATALDAGRTRPVDLARITGAGGYERWFAAVLGAGFDAVVNERANAMRWPKGRRRYDIAIFAELLRLAPRRYQITIDGAAVDQDAVLVAVGNTHSYGGGMRMCPAADPTDGLLDVVIAGPVSRSTLLRLQPRVYKGTHVSHPKVVQYQGRTVTVAGGLPASGRGKGITAYADGERTCPLPITITAVPGALTLLA